MVGTRHLSGSFRRIFATSVSFSTVEDVTLAQRWNEEVKRKDQALLSYYVCSVLSRRAASALPALSTFSFPSLLLAFVSLFLFPHRCSCSVCEEAGAAAAAAAEEKVEEKVGSAIISDEFMLLLIKIRLRFQARSHYLSLEWSNSFPSK